jgi:tetratricopeptide (TPR) repeat protein
MTALPPELGRALDLARRGDLPGARREGERALAAAPADPRCLNFLGILACRAGDLASGAGYLARALAADPADIASRLGLARALVDLGRLAEAAEVATIDPPPGPAGAELGRIAGYAFQEQGRHSEAILSYERLLAHAPGDWEVWNNLGNVRRAAGDPAGALDALARARRLRPDLAAIHFNYGLAAAEAGRPAEAADAFAQALRRDPAHAAAALELGQALIQAGRPEEALAALAAAPTHPETAADLALARGAALVRLERFDAAEAAYRAALAARPNFAAAFLELGVLLEHAHRLDALAGLLAEAEAQAVPPAELAYLHALALQRHGRPAEALAFARQIEPATIGAAQRAHLIGKLADRVGDTAAAFAAFAEMNRIEAAQAPPPGALAAAIAYRRRIEALTALVTPEFYAAWSPARPDPARAAPIFLVGFPRSGTTLLDTILMGHPDLTVLEEEPIVQRVADALGDYERLAALGRDEVDRLRTLYFAELDALAPAAASGRVVDKLPLNIVAAPLIHRIFPDARFIFARRHPCDVVLSCFMQYFRINDAMAAFLDLGEAARLYDAVLALWTRCREVLPLAVHDVRYEALVADPEAELRPLIGFLDLPWHDRLLDHRRTARERGHIKTPSYAQVSERLYARASGRWTRYRDPMGEVLPILSPWAERLGYEV